MKKKYKKGKFPYTVFNTESQSLYVKKSVSAGGGKQRQIWRVCQPPTAARCEEILLEIEAEILTGFQKEEIELAKIFLKVREQKMDFSEFKNTFNSLQTME